MKDLFNVFFDKPDALDRLIEWINQEPEDKLFQFNREVLSIIRDWTKDRQRIADLEDALRPFAHPDLCKMLSGNVKGDASIVFQRDNAFLRIGDFARAQKLLAND
jgi:hypothetical protein